MTEQATAAPAAVTVTAAVTAQPGHENPLQRAEDWFRSHGTQVKGVAGDAEDDLNPLLKGHAAAVFGLAQQVFSSPEMKALEPAVLELVADAGRLLGVAL